MAHDQTGAQLRPPAELLSMIDGLVAEGMLKGGVIDERLSALSEAAEHLRALSTLPRPEGNSSLPDGAIAGTDDGVTYYLDGYSGGAHRDGGWSHLTVRIECPGQPPVWREYSADDLFTDRPGSPVQATSKGGVEPSGDCEASKNTASLPLQEGDLAWLLDVLDDFLLVEPANFTGPVLARHERAVRLVSAVQALSPQTAGAGDTVAQRLREAFMGVQQNKRDGKTADAEPIYRIVNMVPEVLHVLDRMDEFERDAAAEEAEDAAPLPVGEDLRERAARTIYERALQSPAEYPWIEGGNSGKQREARAITDVILALVSQDQWRPMASAPLDGSFIDLWSLSMQRRVPDCRWFTNSSGITAWHAQAGGVAFNMGGSANFAGWQPLPAPPSSKLEG